MSTPREVGSLPVFPSANAPFFDPDTWRLHIGGLVNREQNLSLSDLKNLPSVKIQDDFTCIEGWTVKGIVWRGVRVSELLSLVSMKQSAKCVLFGSEDYTQGLTIERCMAPTTILAYELNNEMLSFENGAPLRLISKSQECFESVKWVNMIHVIDQLVQGSAKNIALERIQKK
jgi:DMSO/TMAO reductase YedYZ molybdopterin-dependent catalytic subunit